MRDFVKRKLCLVAASGCVIGACAGVPAAPAWLDEPAAASVPAGWWSAVGRGATRAEAEDAALVRLAQRVESRVRAVERYREGWPLDRRALIETDARLLGAEIRETHVDRRRGEHAALAAFDPARAAALLAGRVREALAHEPPRLTAELGSWIEQGEALDPGGADWPGLRAAHRAALGSQPASRLEAPAGVAAALRETFGAGATSATWGVAAESSHSRERLLRWRLEAVVSGERRRWSGVASGPDLASAQRRAELDAATALRREREAFP